MWIEAVQFGALLGIWVMLIFIHNRLVDILMELRKPPVSSEELMLYSIWKLRANFYAWRHGLPWGVCETAEPDARTAYDDGEHPVDYAGESVWR